MKPHKQIAVTVLIGAAIGGGAFYAASHLRVASAFAQALPSHSAAPAVDGAVVVQLCDGVTTRKVRGLKPGEQMTHAQALEVTRDLMAQWQRKHPDKHWVMAATGTGTNSQTYAEPSGTANVPSAAGPVPAPSELKSQQGDTYASFHERDFKIWKAQTDAFVAYGKEIFHSTKLLGGTIGVSCDMCHPDASNTHPETYPKYQVQLQRVALLRDMIDWCIENPVKGKTLGPNDTKMRALEAYILAQRKGTPLEYGKH